MRSSSCAPSHGTQSDFESGHISEDSRVLADRLSSHMGIEHAIQVSTENQWHGVLAALLELRQKKTSRI